MLEFVILRQASEKCASPSAAILSFSAAISVFVRSSSGESNNGEKLIFFQTV